MEPRGKELLERLKAEVLVLDGAMGTMLFEAGLLNGACPELWNETHADVVSGIHRAYFDAGADIVETNTFGERVVALGEGGVVFFAIETMMVPDEATTAIRAAKEATGLPVMATMFFQYNKPKSLDRTLWGSTPAEVARFLFDAGADIVGCNCGEGGPARAAGIIREMRQG